MKKILGIEKDFFLKCAAQIKYRSNVFVTFQNEKTVIRYACITLNARGYSLMNRLKKLETEVVGLSNAVNQIVEIVTSNEKVKSKE